MVVMEDGFVPTGGRDLNQRYTIVSVAKVPGVQL